MYVSIFHMLPEALKGAEEKKNAKKLLTGTLSENEEENPDFNGDTLILMR